MRERTFSARSTESGAIFGPRKVAFLHILVHRCVMIDSFEEAIRLSLVLLSDAHVSSLMMRVVVGNSWQVRFLAHLLV